MPRKDKASQAEYKKQYYKKYHKNYLLTKQYGISLETYNEMFENQQGCCAICGKHQAEFKRSLAVDHDHVTGKVHGLLCSGCNNTLGHMKDNVLLLQRAIQIGRAHV